MKDWQLRVNNSVLWGEIQKINICYSEYNFDNLNCSMAFEYSKKTSGSKFTTDFSIEPVSDLYKRIIGDRFDFGKYLTEQILDNLRDYSLLINEYIELFGIYTEYQNKINATFEALKLFKKEEYDMIEPPKRSLIAKFFVDDKTHERYRYDEFLEKSMYEEKVLKQHIYNPVFPYVVLHLSAVTPWNDYKQDFRYEFADIVTCYKRAKGKQGQMAFVQQQRRIVNDSLRYDVMKRDGFRCCICGARAKDGVKLEVDHIRPVSKGGKSTMDNLQTLCERCNKGKRDKFD